MQVRLEGALRKMAVDLEGSSARYRLRCGDNELPMNDLLGSRIKLRYLGEINCVHCGRKTKKSFNQGYCYPCFTKLAECDSCIVSPEKCHFHLGTCRDPAWGEQYCFQSHIVYLANSSGLKVGITRGTQVPTRWIDQGAVQALPILRVDSRYQSGLVEHLFKAEVADKTNWRRMLKNDVDVLDLRAERDRLLDAIAGPLAEVEREFGLQAIQRIDAEEVRIEYPVLNFPLKVSSFNLDKQPEVEGELQGIKGQYLILDGGVINLRKFTAYQVEFSTE
ncbi:hypothetical protein GCM10011348_19160 [Marinobacterium nitratireducens]|uniref:DUF2797 domain-containing protein n=1 Tax=Marinobacterium nitratireducens TaxID=518897 RepID=A0A917ZDH1_9GAMM|nr:DUF2797 domain-containing protein [Marinobacterium nitratireducens]GGO81051.1 hypothetical protein GCM10011348_19160 [Marinobacterium nitratireducens]